MKTLNSNSSEYLVFQDGTSTANASGAVETTSPNNNLAAILKNWILILSPSQPNSR